MTQLTEHFSLEEVTTSPTAKSLKIDNSLPPNLRGAVMNTAQGMERVRTVLGVPISISSWYRCQKLNEALGSKSTSQHPKGEAVDFMVHDLGALSKVCKLLQKYSYEIKYDQLILEHTWIHISWNSIPNAVQRSEVLSLLSTGKYAPGITSPTGQLA